MPTYDYLCKKCGNLFEVFHSMTENPKVKCEKCGSQAVEKQFGAGMGIVFKGSGFYETDYKRASAKESHKTESKKENKKKTPEKNDKK